MKKIAPALGLLLAAWACVSATPEGQNVQVYQADVDSPEAPAPPLPAGCRLLSTSGPIDQEQEDREVSDPYRSQRNQTAALGGNVLYLRSYRFMNLMKTDCPVGDTSPGCMNRSQSWYKVTFRSYACGPAAMELRARAPNPTIPGVFRWQYKKKTPTPAIAQWAAATPTPAAVSAAPAPILVATPAAPLASSRADELKSKVLTLMHEGVGTEVIVSFVRANRPTPPLTAEEIIEWKRAGISDSVIDATFAK